MNPLMVVLLAVASPVVGMSLYDLQTRLERWSQERHAQD